jgi:small subunit ribosomal protein S9
MAATEEFIATGRRKTAVARVRMSSGSGKITINGREFANYFPSDEQQLLVNQPLKVLESTGQFDIRVNVVGGGPMGQATATRHGISRALLKVNVEHRPALKAQGFLTRDPRMRERKKYGQPGARKRYQYSKR